MSLLNFIMVVFPPLIYVLVIYLTSPYKSISITKSLKYFIGGILSIPILTIINLLLPYGDDYFGSEFTFYFFEVGPHEEIAKFISYFIIYKMLGRDEEEHPIGTMFYMGMIGLGFAMIENVSYFYRFGEFVLITRTFTSTLAHMLFGMFTGYWISLSKVKINKYNNRSVFDIFMASNPKIRGFVYSFIGLLCGVGYHGLWNYSLSTSGKASGSIMILMLFIGLLGAKFASNNLRNKKIENKDG